MKSAPAATRRDRRAKHTVDPMPGVSPDIATVSESRRAMEQYNVIRRQLVESLPVFKEVLPQQWPQISPVIDRRETVLALRTATSTLNEGLLIVGFGNGTIIEHLRQDPVGRSKLITVLILEGETEAFAHSLGAFDFWAALSELNLDIHYVKDTTDLIRVIAGVFANHSQITRLAGTTIMSTHPLTPLAEQQRESWMPLLQKTILERYDCLGNDVYDTFLGAKHSLMHGDKFNKRCRSSDYLGRYLNKSAICIASGPSAAAYFDHIRGIQNEHVIICADSILGGLLEHGIEPDFVCMVERPEEMHRLIDAHAPTCKAVMVALPVVHPSSIIPFGERVMWWWNADDLYPWIDPKEALLHSGRSAGTITVAMAGLLKVKTAYLVGHDLAFKDGQSHCAGVNAMALETQTTINRDLSRNNPNYYRRVLDAEKNGGGSLETMGVWDIFRSDLEIITHAHAAQTTFINLNINTKTGAAISGTVAGELPASTGLALEKSHPELNRSKEDEWPKYRERCLLLRKDFDLVKKRFKEISEELVSWKPLNHDRKEVEAMGERVDLTKIVSVENRPWFAYVFRAALRNLMVRLHHNTYVRTMAERNWNQVQIMRLYVESIPSLIDRLRPELDLALENFK